MTPEEFRGNITSMIERDNITTPSIIAKLTELTTNERLFAESPQGQAYEERITALYNDIFGYILTDRETALINYIDTIITRVDEGRPFYQAYPFSNHTPAHNITEAVPNDEDHIIPAGIVIILTDCSR